MDTRFRTVKELEDYLLEKVSGTIAQISNDLMNNYNYSNQDYEYDVIINLINRAKISCHDRLKNYENRYKYSNGDNSTKEKILRQIDIEKIKLVALDKYLKEVEYNVSL